MAVKRKAATVRKKSATKKKVAKKAAATKKRGRARTVSKAPAKKKSPAKKKAKATPKAAAKKKPSKAKQSAPKPKPRPRKKASARKNSAPRARSAARSVLSGPLFGFDPYKPQRGEEYMSDDQLKHFRNILLSWKKELMEEVDRTVHHMKDEAANFPDPNDRATQESEFGLELRTRDRERKLLKKIDSALERIDDGSYGFCEETGEEIGLKRLEARPVATLSVEAQERRELAERQYRDRDDRYR